MCCPIRVLNLALIINSTVSAKSMSEMRLRWGQPLLNRTLGGTMDLSVYRKSMSKKSELTTHLVMICTVSHMSNCLTSFALVVRLEGDLKMHIVFDRYCELRLKHTPLTLIDLTRCQGLFSPSKRCLISLRCGKTWIRVELQTSSSGR
jgi:hypothetical protein